MKLFITFLSILLLAVSVIINAHETGIDLSEWDHLNLHQGLDLTSKKHAFHRNLDAEFNHHHRQAEIHHNDKIARVQKSKMTCDECKMIVGILQSIANSPSSTNSTIEMIDGLVCAKQNTTEKVKICKDVVSLAFKTVLPLVFKGVKSLAWNVPVVFCSGIVKICKENCCEKAPTVPQQVFLSFANSSDWYSSFSVTWVTQVETPGASLKWGSANSLTGNTAELPTRTYTYGGWVGVIHQAIMTGLAPSTTYWYQVGSDQYGWSTNYTFTTMGTDIGMAQNPLRVMTIADVGWGPNSDDTIKTMTSMLDGTNGNNKTFHVLQVTGDVGYADFQQSAWDFFMNKFEPVFARVPCQFARGNHESTWANGTAYRYRLAMSQPKPGFGAPDDAFYFHQKIGTAHFVTMDSETAFDTADIDKRQVQWATDVMNANPKSTASPFLVALHHRPLYCTEHGLQCGLFSDILRSQVEGLYNDKKVDMVISGHIHTHLVSWPTVNGTVAQKNYQEPTAPVYAIVGNPGNREGNGSPHDPSKHPWLNEGYSTIGFSLLEFRSSGNQHVLSLTGYESSTGNQLDQIVLQKTL